jgi:hypothetical protein
MKTLITLILVFLAFKACAAEEKWFCTDDQAMKSGNTLMICGVGTAYDEGHARQRALENSMQEFQAMCNASADCRGHQISIEPKRSTCLESAKKWHAMWENYTCHRLIVFTIN